MDIIGVPFGPQYSLIHNHHFQGVCVWDIQHFQGVVCELLAQEFGILQSF